MRGVGLAVCLSALISGTAVASTSSAAAALYTIDPVIDGSMIVASAGLAGVMEAIISTGEIRPQEPGDPSLLLGIDRPVALASDIESGSSILSDLSVATASVYAVTDVLLYALLDRGDSPVTVGALYVETAALNVAIADLFKIGVRRPRPRAYQAAREHPGEPLSSTDLSLSFYSLHTSMTAGLGATATYLAFARSPDGIEGWIALGSTVLLTTFVGWQRIRDRAHFPTDVIAGAIAGGAIGTLVPALHRATSARFALGGMVAEDGGGLTISGVW